MHSYKAGLAYWYIREKKVIILWREASLLVYQGKASLSVYKGEIQLNFLSKGRLACKRIGTKS
jgi:hypothetical protein